MSAGKFHYKALTNAYGKDHLLEQGRINGVDWQEHSHEGVNWMRFSGALHRHLDGGKDFHVDNTDPQTLATMLGHYKGLRDAHKQTMIPHVRAAMAKLHADGGDGSKGPMDYLHEAYSHLEANGGHHWSEKVHSLNHLNNHISKLTDRLGGMGYKV